MNFVRRHKSVTVGVIVALSYAIYLTLVIVGAIPAMVFPVYLGLVALGAVPALTFPIYYSVKVRWWLLRRGPERETAGHLVMFSTLFALLYVRGGINIASGPGREALHNQSPGNAAFLMFLATLAAFVAWQRVVLFHRGRKLRAASTINKETG